MDSAAFAVTLIDKITGPARSAIRSIQNVSGRFDQMKKSADAARKASEAAFRAKGFSQDKQGRWRGPGGKFVGDGQGPRAGGFLGFVDKLDPKKFLAKSTKSADAAVDYMVDKAKTAAKWAAIGGVTAAAGVGALIVKNTVHMANFEETSRVAFHSLTGSAAGADQAWESTLKLSRTLGQDIEGTAESLKHLLAMQFKLPEAEELVKISADLQSVTGSAESSHRALTAITQIKAKGKLQAEELVGQLAEAGVSTVLVYEQLAKLTGKSEDNVKAMISKGQIGADVGIAAIKAAILQKTHSSSAGDARVATASNTMEGLLGQLKIAPQFLFVRLGQAVKANLDKFRPLVERITKAIDGIQGDQMTRFIGKVLDMGAKLVPLALEFAAGFGEGFSAIVDAMGAADGAAPPLEKARALGKMIADAFGLVLTTIGKVVDAVKWLDDRGLLGVVAGLFVANKAVDGLKEGFGGLLGLALKLTKPVEYGFKAGYKIGELLIDPRTKAFGGKAADVAGQLARATGQALSRLATASAAVFTAFGNIIIAGATTVFNAVSTALTGIVAGLGGAAAAAAAGAAILGIAAAVAGIIWREQIAQWMLDTFAPRSDQQNFRGLNPPQPTDAAKGLAASAAQKQTTNQVKFESTVNITGDGKDAAEIGRNVQTAQKGMLDLFFQSHALEAGAM